MAITDSSENLEKILKAPDYRSFISLIITERKKSKRFGYSHIARFGGFKARSFPRDVVSGKKRITLNSLPKFIKGLGLTSDLAEYFRILVEIDEVDCRTRNGDLAKLMKMKSNVEKRIASKQSIQLTDGQDRNFIHSSIPKIYASLGSLDVGVHIESILKKTSLPESEVHRCLEFMVQQKLVRKSKAKYFPTENHLNFQNLKSDIFKKHFVNTAEESIVMSKKHIQSEEKLFLSSSFSVNKAELPKLKEELRSLLLKYIDSSENSDGDRVINLVASLY